MLFHIVVGKIFTGIDTSYLRKKDTSFTTTEQLLVQ